MKRFALFAAAAVVALASIPASAVPVPFKITYTLPTTGCTAINDVPVIPCDNVALAANAVTGVDVYVSKAPIADNAAMAPTFTIAAGQTTYTGAFQAGDGDKLYFRLKARTAGGASPFSNAATKDVSVKVVPNSPVIVTIDIVT